MKPNTVQSGVLTSGTHIATQFAPVAGGKLQAKKTIIGRIETVLKFVKSRADLLKQLDEQLPSVMLQCLYHYEKHGDTSLVDMLVKGVYASDEELAQELMFWFRKYSPIAWDKDGKIILRDKTEHPLNVEGAEGTEYHQEAEVKAKREASKRAVQPFGPKVAFQRIQGTIAQLEKALQPDGRGIAEGVDAADLKNRLMAIAEFARTTLGLPLVTDAKAETATDDKLPAAPAGKLIRNGKTVAAGVTA